TSNATAINESGTIVGSSGYEPPETSESYRAFSYSAGTMTNLGTLAVGGYSHAYGVNNSGTVVGWASVSYGVNQAFSYTSSEGMKNLGSLPGGASSAAYGINDSSTVVGYSNASSGYNHAFSYSDGTMTDLGILPGYVNSYALGINDSGTIVGDASTQYGNASHAIIYSDGAWSDLNNPTLTLNLPSGWLMEEATAINASGDIVGYGQNASELDEAFLLTPTPEPGSLALLAVGGIGLLIRRRNNRR
ncbi:MAG TPA: PEP-CTERM sorting domain-containing protein, partial [Phycisphaerae bacterium]|nr:PEP-CTERM sorting domain-containing protein [Phycisphaerae bacterium]